MRHIVKRMEEIGARAKERMSGAPHSPNLQYAEILWMTPDEAQEFLILRLKLPSRKEEAEMAACRIAAKIAARKENRSP